MRFKPNNVQTLGEKLRDLELGESLSGKVEVALDIFTDDWLLVVAGNIVPLYPVAVVVVEDSHASFIISVKLHLLPVVRLGLWRSGPAISIKSQAIKLIVLNNNRIC